MNGNFFDEKKEQSEVKTAIVTKYFGAWAKVIAPWAKRGSGKIAYIDLFAGPGRYKDGTTSTPLLLVQRAIADPQLRSMLVTLFNDGSAEHASQLRAELAALPGLATLTHQPQVINLDVGSEIVAKFEEMKLVPTLFFVDPWGYKGLSLRLINSVLKDWGCDCIFFFNYNRINMGITNPYVIEHMNALFGEERADWLRGEVSGMTPEERELTIVENLCSAIQEMGGEFVLPFRFNHPQRGRTMHHLMFVSKHVRGYEIMKEIMAKESSAEQQGVASFEYNPASTVQGLLFDLARPLDELGDLLLEKFSGMTLSMRQVYENHHVGHQYIRKNYKAVLNQLEASGKIRANPPAASRVKRKGVPTFADRIVVTFPQAGLTSQIASGIS